jgi:hypothetical protein
MRLILALVFSSVVCAVAQTPVSCRLLGFPGVQPPPMAITVADGTRVPCEVPAGALSPPVQCRSEQGVIRFYQAEAPGAKANPAAPPRVLANAKVPGKANSLILVFFPAGEKAALPWRTVAFEDTPQAFPDGGAVVANFHQSELRFLIGEHRVQLNPGLTKPVTCPERRDDFNMAPVIFQFNHEGQWRAASESMLRFTQGLRYLIIGYQDPASKRPRLFTCADPVAPPPPPVRANP